jgi:hypothetical protein
VRDDLSLAEKPFAASAVSGQRKMAAADRRRDGLGLYAQETGCLVVVDEISEEFFGSFFAGGLL